MGLLSLFVRLVTRPSRQVVGAQPKPGSPPPPTFGSAAFLHRPAEACRFAARTVKLSYVDAEGEESFRTVTVDEIVRQRGCLYLSAYCHERFDRRHFRLDRIVAMSRFADGEPVDPAAEVARWTRGG